MLWVMGKVQSMQTIWVFRKSTFGVVYTIMISDACFGCWLATDRFISM